MTARIKVGSPGTVVEGRYTTLPKAVDAAVKKASALKRRGRADCKHYVRPVRRPDGTIMLYAVLRRSAR